MENVELPSSLKVLGISNLSSCRNLKRLRLPEGLEEIKLDRLLFCGLEEVTVPRTIVSLDDRAFWATNLRVVNVADGCRVDIRQYVTINVVKEDARHVSQEQWPSEFSETSNHIRLVRFPRDGQSASYRVQASESPNTLTQASSRAARAPPK